MEALLPLLTSSATTRASRSGNILANIVWFRSILPLLEGSDLGWPLGETPAAEKADSSNEPILSTESRLPTRSATSSKGSRSCVATAAMGSEGCWWLRSPVGAPKFVSLRPLYARSSTLNKLFFCSLAVPVTPAAFAVLLGRLVRPAAAERLIRAHPCGSRTRFYRRQALLPAGSPHPRVQRRSRPPLPGRVPESC